MTPPRSFTARYCAKGFRACGMLHLSGTEIEISNPSRKIDNISLVCVSLVQNSAYIELAQHALIMIST